MRSDHLILRAALVLMPIVIAAPSAVEGQPGRGGGQGRGPNFPQQQRKLADPTVVARGKGLYESTCAACHGIDLRGGQQGGPNLLRSQTVLLDKESELIAQVVTAGRPNPAGGATPMPAFPLPPDDIKAIAEYLHSVASQAGHQGRPPRDTTVGPERVLVGDPAAGQAYFAARCSSCHSITGDLKAIGTRAPDPRELQNLWVSGGGGGGRAGRGGRGRGGGESVNSTATVRVTPSSGPPIEGRLVRIDDFLVTVTLADGTRRTIPRHGAEPGVEIQDPADAHRTLVPALSDADMHNVTAYLWSIK